MAFLIKFRQLISLYHGLDCLQLKNKQNLCKRKKEKLKSRKIVKPTEPKLRDVQKADHVNIAEIKLVDTLQERAYLKCISIIDCRLLCSPRKMFNRHI